MVSTLPWVAGSAVILAAPGMALAADDRPITFADVLANPGDLRLNLAYAQQRIDDGDLLAAAAALERLLLSEPNFDEARVLYAGVLYRLGDVSAARREAALLQDRPLRPEAVKALRQYEAAAVQRDGVWDVGGALSVGYGYDDNIATLVSEDAGLAVEDERSSVVVRGGINIERSLSAGGDLAAFANASGLIKDFAEDGVAGFTVAGAAAGLTGTKGDLLWKGGASVRHVRVDGEGYLTEVGGIGRVTLDLSRETSLTIHASAYDQSYDAVFDGAEVVENGRDGRRVEGGVRLRHQFDARLGASVGIGYRDKTADDPNFAYDFVGVDAQADVVSQSGVYAIANGFYRDYKYDGGRDDDFLYVRGAVGAPLSVFSKGVGSPVLNDISVEAAVRYVDRESNIDTFDAENIGLEGRLIYRF